MTCRRINGPRVDQSTARVERPAHRPNHCVAVQLTISFTRWRAPATSLSVLLTSILLEDFQAQIKIIKYEARYYLCTFRCSSYCFTVWRELHAPANLKMPCIVNALHEEQNR